MLRENLFAFHNLKLQKHIIHAKWMVLFFLIDDNQNSCSKFTNIFVTRAVDYEWKFYYNWPEGQTNNSKLLNIIFETYNSKLQYFNFCFQYQSNKSVLFLDLWPLMWRLPDFNDSHWEKLNSVQEFIKMKYWLFLIFPIYLHYQIQFRSVNYMLVARTLKNFGQNKLCW